MDTTEGLYSIMALYVDLHDLLKKDNFHWSEIHTTAFQKLKNCLISAPILTLPNFSQPFILETDASGNGIGAVVM